MDRDWDHLTSHFPFKSSSSPPSLTCANRALLVWCAGGSKSKPSSGGGSKERPKPSGGGSRSSSDVVELTADNFKEMVLDSNDMVRPRRWPQWMRVAGTVC